VWVRVWKGRGSLGGVGEGSSGGKGRGGEGGGLWWKVIKPRSPLHLIAFA
jgi:hypothetical protein